MFGEGRAKGGVSCISPLSTGDIKSTTAKHIVRMGMGIGAKGFEIKGEKDRSEWFAKSFSA